jgi:hypothetical protein
LTKGFKDSSGRFRPTGGRSGSNRAPKRGGSSMSRIHRRRGGDKLTTEERNRLPDKDFAVILKDGTRKYPIEDEAHARDALARVSANGNPEEIAEVRRKVHERYPGIEVSGLD